MKKLIKQVLGINPSRAQSGDMDVQFYDHAFATVDEYHKDYWNSRYYFCWTVICDRMRRDRLLRVLEIGCGPGQLAQFLIEYGVTQYTGLDLSTVAIDLAKSKAIRNAEFLQGDALSTDVYTTIEYDVFLATEVLEHVTRDMDILKSVPTGKRCLCTVPSFPYTSHVRHFDSQSQVEQRYSELFDRFNVYSLRRPGNDITYYYLFDGVRR